MQQFRIEKNSMNLEGINELLTLYNKNLIKEIDKLLHKHMKGMNLDIISNFFSN